MDATALYWPDKARALADLASRSARLPVVRALAAELGIAGLPGGEVADRVRLAVAERVAFEPEEGDHFAMADEVLTRGADDCDGHAVLAAATAAAAGHPARIVALRYRGELQPVHVRAEVGDLAGWHSADSTIPPGLDLSRLEVHPQVAAVSAEGRGPFGRLLLWLGLGGGLMAWAARG